MRKSFLPTIIVFLLMWTSSYSQQIDSLLANSKNRAFEVLRTKCNVCHATKKRTDIFTLGNMDSLATDINVQVFIRKKMPKGKKVVLTDTEVADLKAWLVAVLKD